MSIHEHMPPQVRKELKEVGWTKGLELPKVTRKDGQDFDCATWLHGVRPLPKDQFKRAMLPSARPSQAFSSKRHRLITPVRSWMWRWMWKMFSSSGQCTSLAITRTDYLSNVHQ